jgi:hypothetical protein
MTLIERAEALFERFIGDRIQLDTYTVTLDYGDKGAVIRNSNVVDVLSVRAKASTWVFEDFFGNTEWVDIDMTQIVTHWKDGKLHINLPPTLFGTSYKEVEVTYVAGYEEIPEDIIAALREIEDLLRKGTITEWNCILPVSILDVINKYRKEVFD